MISILINRPVNIVNKLKKLNVFLFIKPQQLQLTKKQFIRYNQTVEANSFNQKLIENKTKNILVYAIIMIKHILP